MFNSSYFFILAFAVSKVNYCFDGNLKNLGTILSLITIMINERLKHIFQSCKCKRWLTKVSGALRQAQGPGFLPTVSELVELGVMSCAGAGKKENSHDKAQTNKICVFLLPCFSVSFRGKCFSLLFLCLRG